MVDKPRIRVKALTQPHKASVIDFPNWGSGEGHASVPAELVLRAVAKETDIESIVVIATFPGDRTKMWTSCSTLEALWMIEWVKAHHMLVKPDATERPTTDATVIPFPERDP